MDTAKSALQQAPELKIARQELEGAIMDTQLLRSRYLPQLSLGLQAGGNADKDPAGSRGYSSLNSTLSLTQTVLDLPTMHDVSGARKKVQVAEARLRQIEQDLLLEIAIAWSGYWRALEQQKINEENIRLLKEYYDGAQVRFQSGELTITDVSLASTKYQASLLQKVRYAREIERSRAILKEATGASASQSIEMPTLFIDRLGSMELATLLEEHPAVKPLRSELESLDESILAQKAGHYPTLQLFARYNNQLDGPLPSSSYPDNAGSLGLELSLPLFSGFRVERGISKSMITKSRQLLELGKLKQELDRDIQTAQSDFRQSSEEFELARKRLSLSLETLKWMTDEFHAGTRSSVDIFFAQADMIQARIEEISAQEQCTRFLFTYLHAIGRLTLEQLQKLSAGGGETP